VSRSAPVVLLATLALALGGCGAASTSSSSSKFKGEQAAVAKVVDQLSSAGRSKDAAKICSDILSPSLVAQIKADGADCQAEMKKTIEDADDYDLEVLSVSVNDHQAQAKVRQGKNGQVATFSFDKENGGWRATSLGG
jgi:hypothetical protein